MKQINVTGADLTVFHTASRQYRDMTQFWRILQANYGSATAPGNVGNGDTAITTMGTLSIPPNDPTLSGGVPPQ